MATASKKKMTRKEKSAKNKRAYAETARSMGGRGYRPPSAKPQKERAKVYVPRDLLDGHALRRARGTRTDEDCVNEILEMISGGALLIDAREHVGLSHTQWGGWVREDRQFWPEEPRGLKARYAAAKELQADAWADIMVSDADSATHDDYQGHKLRFEVRRWNMGKNVQKYADKSVVQHEGGKTPVRHINSDMTPEEAAAAYAKSLQED